MPEVTFELAIDQVPLELSIRQVTIDERLNGLPVCTVTAYSEVPPPPARDLLRRNCKLDLRRDASERRFQGIVWQAHVREGHTGGYLLNLRLTTAAHLLMRIVDTFMYQDKSVPEIVKDLVERYLGRMQRTVELGLLQRTYPVHEYTLQYHESVFDFLCRLCESEGIFFFFDHGAGAARHEVLTLADKTRGLPRAHTVHAGAVPFVSRESHDAEGVTVAEHVEEVGTTDIVLDGYDWTNRDTPMRQERTGRGAGDPALEIYDPHDSIHYYDYRNQHYEANDGSAQAELRTDLLDVERQWWHLECNVVTVQPGHLLTLTGAPDPELDQEYVITAVTTTGSAGTEQVGHVHSSAHCVPSSMAYRPPRVTRRPTVFGPETARVVGGASDEIHTDEHGRIKVQFHWDRQHSRNDESSCWIRVAQSWAGQGFGTLFIPRVDMEVVVSFVGGNPDRPLVTGCVYNDKNRPHVALPQDKSQSAIRTKSTAPGAGGNSTGYNEILFEDKLGNEFISVHAQRDLMEEVLRDRTTRIHRNDRLTVTNNSYTRIHNEETRTVDDTARWTYKAIWSRNIAFLETWIGHGQDEAPAKGEFYWNGWERRTQFGKLGAGVQWEDTADSYGQLTQFKNSTRKEIKLEAGRFVVHNSDSVNTVLGVQMSTWIGLDAQADAVGIRAVNACMLSVFPSNYVQMVGRDMILNSDRIRIRRSPCEIEITANHITMSCGTTSKLRIDETGVSISAPILHVSAGVVTRGGNPMWD